MHQRKTAAIRFRAFRAAAGFDVQIGARHPSTSALAMRSTGMSRSGAAWRRNVDSHCSGSGLPVFQPSRWSSMVRSAASANVGTPHPRGSLPWRTARLLSSAFRRASASVISGYGPSPIEVSRPSILTR